MVAGFDPKVARGMEPQLAKLDELLELIGDAPEDAECPSAQEHLQAARTYLLGAMPLEYELSLEMAEEAIAAIAQRDVRLKAERLLHEIRKAQPVPMM
ncbi:MAG TPA: hypothetical protein VIY49_05060 [Bryobacteraceae bacterium]